MPGEVDSIISILSDRVSDPKAATTTTTHAHTYTHTHTHTHTGFRGSKWISFVA